MTLEFLSENHAALPVLDELCQEGEITCKRVKTLNEIKLSSDNDGHILLIDEAWVEKNPTKLNKKYVSDFTTSVLLTTKTNDQTILLLKKHDYICHVLSCNSEDFAEIFRTLKSYYKSNSFALPTMWKQDPQKLIMQNSSDRKTAYEQVSKYAGELEVFSEFPDIVETISSELITNAFYDAPRNEKDEPINPSRQAEVTLSPPSQVEFKYGVCKDNYLWINTTDTFGTFTKEKIISSLYRAASERKALVQQEGGAGLGLFMMLNWSAAMYFFLDEEEKTSVWCKVRITKRRRHFDRQQSSLIIFC